MLARLGQLVSSKAGRDQGKYFFILEIRSENWVLIADGKLRRAEKPKMKKLRHLVLHPQIDAEIEKKLLTKETVTDRELQQALLRMGITE